jgi:hypothetical protein
MSFFRRSHGGSTKSVELGADISINSVGTTSASSTYRIDANAGTYTSIRAGSINVSSTFKWAFRGDFSAFYVRAQSLAGSIPTGTLNTWLQTNTNRSWALFTTSGLADNGTILIEISNVSDGSVVLDSHVVTLDSTCV